VISNEKSEYLLYDFRDKTKPYHASDMKQFIFDPLRILGYRKDYLEFFRWKSSRYDGDPKGLLHLSF
jgi:hypothetical protein